MSHLGNFLGFMLDKKPRRACRGPKSCTQSSFTWRSASILLFSILGKYRLERQRRSLGMATRTAGGNAAFHNFHNDYAHIADPNERRRLALAEIDKAPFGWYHVRAIVVAGIGFFTVR
jgi:hypothetical protein